MPRRPDRVTRRELAAIDHYVVHGKPKAAMVAAGYPNSSVLAKAHKFFDTPRIKRVLDQIRANEAERLRKAHDETLLAIAEIAFADPRACVDDQGRIRPINEWPTAIARTVQSFRVDEDGRPTDVKFWSKSDALDKLGRHLGIWEDTKEDTTVNVVIAGYGQEIAADIRTIDAKDSTIKEDVTVAIEHDQANQD